jgi:hypothetical protein
MAYDPVHSRGDPCGRPGTLWSPSIFLQCSDQVEEGDFIFASYGRVDSILKQVISVEKRVESIETDMSVWID